MNNSYDYYELELYHHGIKGQKWGVRRTAEQLGHYVKRKLTRKTLDERIKAQEEKNRLLEAKAQAQENKNRLAAAKNAYKVARAKNARDVETAESEETLTRETRKRKVRDLKQDQRDRLDQLRKEMTGADGGAKSDNSQKHSDNQKQSDSNAKNAGNDTNGKTSAIRSGNRQEILKYRDSMSNSELREALDRIDLNNRLDAIGAKQMDATYQKYRGYLRTAVDDAKFLVGAYNVFANTMNTFSSKEFATIPTGGDKKKKKKKDDD